LYLNNKDSNENRTQNDSVEAGVTEVTVKNRIKEFLSLLEKYEPEAWR
jgi:transcription initiation factor TFIIIB Brf1 subunit/transcription initiation factor TFIIB